MHFFPTLIVQNFILRVFPILKAKTQAPFLHYCWFISHFFKMLVCKWENTSSNIATCRTTFSSACTNEYLNMDVFNLILMKHKTKKS